jgi:hypothetical protein
MSSAEVDAILGDTSIRVESASLAPPSRAVQQLAEEPQRHLVRPYLRGYDRLEGVDYAVKTLNPRAILASGGDSTEFVLLDVAATPEKYQDRTRIFCPEHRGDMFILRN